jgi:hypothetical protein
MEAVLRRRLGALKKTPGMNLQVFVNPGEEEWDTAEASMGPAYFFWVRRSKQVDWNLETVLAETQAMIHGLMQSADAKYGKHALLLRVRKQPPAFEGDKDIRCNVSLFGAQLWGK